LNNFLGQIVSSNSDLGQFAHRMSSQVCGSSNDVTIQESSKDAVPLEANEANASQGLEPSDASESHDEPQIGFARRAAHRAVHPARC
jgi:hypothetical protein